MSSYVGDELNSWTEHCITEQAEHRPEKRIFCLFIIWLAADEYKQNIKNGKKPPLWNFKTTQVISNFWMDWRRSFIHDNTTHIKWSPYLFGSAAAEPDSKSLKWILKGKENMAHVIKFSISSTYLFQSCKRQLFMGFDSSLFNLGVRSPKTI